MLKVDVTIIGAGPAGLTAATYLARSSKSFVLIDKDAPGGRLNTLPEIENYPGFKSVSGMELANAFIDSASALGVETTYGNVMSVYKENDRFVTKTDMESYESLAVIVATGITFAPTIKGEKEFLGKGVSYCATCDGRFFKGKNMAVCGNGDEAIQEALYLAPLSSKLFFICPNKIKGNDKLVSALRHLSNVEILEDSSLKEISGESKVSSILVNDKIIDVEAVFPLNGPKSASGFLSNLGLELNKGFIKTNSEQETSVPGLYAAGDILDKKLRQVVTAAGEGALAATSAIKYINETKK